MLRIAICDGDMAAAGSLEEMVIHAFPPPHKPRIEVFTRGDALLHDMAAGEFYDILFLDVFLGNMSGVEVGRKIRHEQHNEATALIFVSAHEECFKELYPLNTSAFVSKPVQEEELLQAIQVVCLRQERAPGLFLFRDHTDVFQVPYRDILYFESRRHLVTIVTKHYTRSFYGKIDEVKEALHSPDFVRIGQSIIVNFSAAERLGSAEMHMLDGKVHPVSRSYQREVKERIAAYMQRINHPGSAWGGVVAG